MRLSVRTPLVRRALVAAVALAVLAPATPARAASDPLTAAVARVTAAEKAQAEATAGFEQAWQEHSALEGEITKTERGIAVLTKEQKRLAKLSRRRALAAYTGTDLTVLDTFFVNPNDLLEASVRTTMLDRLNAQGDAAIEQLSGVSDELQHKRKDLEDKLAASDKALVAMRSRRVIAEKALNEAAAAEKALRKRLEAERRAAEYAVIVAAARARARAEAAAAAAAQAAQSSSSGSSGNVSSDPVGTVIGSGSWVCPVQGPHSFTNDWGTPRSGGRFHKGNDIFSPRGTPVVAPVAGSVFFQADPLGGNAAYVNGNDGNTYYMAHLNDYVGGGRAVQAGEIVGHVGNTGNASDAPPHVHFEIRPGGPNGAQINPYFTLSAHC